MKCSVCYEWCPHDVDGVGAHDEKAYCRYCKEETYRDFCCPHGSIIDPNKLKGLKKSSTKKETKPKVEREIDHDEVKSAILYEHQKEALEKFKDKEDIALFFEMGCGKTLTCLKIAEYKYNKGEIDSLLVIAPNDVHKQWYDDLVHPKNIKMIDVPFEAQCVGGRGGEKQLYPFEDNNKFHIVTVNVDTFSTPHKWEPIVDWANGCKCMIAVDEATIIKNPSSKRAQRILYEFNDVVRRRKTVVSSTKKCPVRAVLTGTPVTNGPMDLWAIMEFVHPNYFNRNYYSFREHFGMFTKLTVDTNAGVRDVPVLLTEKTWKAIHECSSYMEAACMFGCSEETYMTISHQDHFVGPYKHADELKKLIEPVSVFRKLVDCVDMPKTIYVSREVGMNAAQEACYKNMKNNMLALYEGYEATASNKLVANMRLQQISSGFIMGSKSAEGFDASVFGFDESQLDDIDVMPNEVVWLGDSNPKLDALMRDVDEADKPLLILTRYTAEADKIFNLCNEKYSTCLITGWKTVGSIEEFKEGKYDIMVANSSKIARGFNLQIAHTTLFYSNTFSMETRQQAEFRTFRIGQTHPCTYIDYVSSQADRVITKALQMKKNLLDFIRDEDKDIKDII